jgi:phosphatidylserine/phosphatidylglycerophosphate/cardiolipin synthase-like enzyme
MLRRPDDPDEPSADSANLNGRGLATDSEINISTTDSRTARELRLRLWAEHLACTEDDLRHAAPAAILDGRWVAAAHQQHCIVTRRSGPLTAALTPTHVDTSSPTLAPLRLSPRYWTGDVCYRPLRHGI